MEKLTMRALLTAFGLLDAPLIAGGTDTTVATGDAGAVQKWRDKIWVEMPRVMYFRRFMVDNSMNAIIEVATDLEKGPGDKLTFTLLRKLNGAGADGDNAMENNEEQMRPYEDTITLNQTRNAVRLSGRLSERRTAWNQREKAKELLTDPKTVIHQARGVYIPKSNKAAIETFSKEMKSGANTGQEHELKEGEESKIPK